MRLRIYPKTLETFLEFDEYKDPFKTYEHDLYNDLIDISSKTKNILINKLALTEATLIDHPL